MEPLMHTSSVFRSRPQLLLATVMLFLAACASDTDERPRPPKATREQRALPTLAGQAAFFDGQILAEIRVGALAGFDRSGDGASRDGAHGRRGGFRMRGTGGMHDTDGLGSGSHRGGPPPDAEGAREGAPVIRPMDRMAGPPVMIHLRFTNHGTERVELRIVDFLSPLGNFVVQPEKLVLEPGQSAETEPMTSRIAGEASDSEITLNLQAGARRETKTMELRREPDPENGNTGHPL
jgi:hypothetical protein